MTPHPRYDNPSTLPEPLGVYSHVARAGDLLFVAGQVGAKADGSLAGPDVGSQLEQTFENLRLALESAGASLRDIVKTTTYLPREENLEEFIAARVELFRTIFPEGEYPPNTLLIGTRLINADFEIEIEAIAYSPQRQP
jgi:enamine deaminase RidA (YjgF/YER057c/UK114 family)